MTHGANEGTRATKRQSEANNKIGNWPQHTESKVITGSLIVDKRRSLGSVMNVTKESMFCSH